MSREQAELRRAAILKKRAEEERLREEQEQRIRRYRLLRGILLSLILLLLFGIIVLFVRSCSEIRSASLDAESAHDREDKVTTAPSFREEDDGADDEQNTPAAPTAARPASSENTVTLTDEIDSGYAVLTAPGRDLILAAKNADTRMNPASMTKVMTLLVAYENVGNLDDTFTVTSKIIDPLYKAEASLAGFSPGETVTVRDLLYGTILPSGAEAAVSLAIHVAGSEEEFVKLMNKKAEELSLTDTHFTNCSGLHDKNHYSTAVEIAMIMDYVLQYEECRAILSAYHYTTAPSNKHPEGILLESTMLSRMHGDEPDGVTVFAGKTGYTPQAGNCLVSAGSDDTSGEVFILVTSDAKGKYEPIYDAIKLYSEYTN